jgi:hypothetical protein
MFNIQFYILSIKIVKCQYILVTTENDRKI